MRVNRRGITAGLVAALALTAVAAVGRETQPRVVAVRRITESQYRHAIADVFGSSIKVNARFEPDVRRDGLLAIGASSATISANGLAQYFAAARAVAEQVAPDGPVLKGPCAPRTPTQPDDACMARWVREYGERLLQRPLSQAEVARRVRVAAGAATARGQFNAGLRAAFVSLLTAPDFLFRIERTAPGRADAPNLDDYSRAARISYLLWDAPPDETLLRAARAGELSTRAGLQAQVDRLMASPRVQDGLLAFFADFLQLDLFDSLTKDPAQYPKFSQAVAVSAREQALRVVASELMRTDGDYRTLFTTRDTFINRPLGAIYRVPYAGGGDWTKYRFDEASGQSGLLTQVAFASLFAHPGRTSPTRRGAAINEIFLCQTVPQPPANVDLSGLNNAANPGKTVRERLQFHRNQPTCSGCHTMTDPMGLTLEQFDGIGQRRTWENGAAINVQDVIFGKTVSGAQGLGQLLHDDPRVPACLIKRLYAYGQGRSPDPRAKVELADQTEAFRHDGFNVPRAMRRLAMSEAFYAAPLLAPDARGVSRP